MTGPSLTPFPLTSFGCESYLCFPSSETVELRPLTLVLGRNNSGKSALVRLPRLILAALHGRSTYGVPLKVDELQFAERFVELVHRQDFFGFAGFACTLVDGGQRLSVDARIRNLSTLSSRDEAVVERWSSEGSVNARLELETDAGGPPRLAGTPSDGDLLGLLPATDPRFVPWRRLAANASAHVSHLGPVRAHLQPGYQVAPNAPLGLDGQGAPAQLAASTDLSEAVGHWFQTNVEGWRIEVSSAGDTFSLELSQGDVRVNACRAGQGIHQVLPIVVQQLGLQVASSKPRRDQLLTIVEQPELHLHDAAQAPLGDLFVDTALSHNAKVLVETHSEALFLRVRRRVADGTLPPEKLAVYFVGPRQPGEPNGVHPVPVNRDGSLEWWPQGVFLERYDEVRKLQQAQRE